MGISRRDFMKTAGAVAGALTSAEVLAREVLEEPTKPLRLSGGVGVTLPNGRHVSLDNHYFRIYDLVTDDYQYLRLSGRTVQEFDALLRSDADVVDEAHQVVYRWSDAYKC